MQIPHILVHMIVINRPFTGVILPGSFSLFSLKPYFRFKWRRASDNVGLKVYLLKKS